MPKVLVSADERSVPYESFRDICVALPHIVADALATGDGGNLTPAEIMVKGRFHEKGSQRNEISINTKDLNIDVFAHEYPERWVNLDERRARIEKALADFIPAGASWYVWIWLGQTSYGSDTV